MIHHLNIIVTSADLDQFRRLPHTYHHRQLWQWGLERAQDMAQKAAQKAEMTQKAEMAQDSSKLIFK